MHRFHQNLSVSGAYTLPGYTATPSGAAAVSVIIPALLLFLALLIIGTVVNAASMATPIAVVDDKQALNIRGDIERSMWVTSPEDIIYSVGSAKEDLFQFCANPKGSQDPTSGPYAHRAITHLFVNAHGFVVSGQEEADSMRSFLREAHLRGIKVDFSDGEPTWVNKDGGEANLVMNAVMSFQRQGAPEERFDGVMLRVEPYLLRGWYSPSLWNQYTQFLNTMRNKIRASNTNTRFGVTIPRWFDQTLGLSSLKEVYVLVDNVLVLSNVDQERVLVDCISTEVALADSMMVRVFASVETGSSVLSNSTFRESGWLPMEHAASGILKAYVLNRSFAGLVVNDYQSYRTIRRTAHSLAGVGDNTLLPEFVLAGNNGAIVDNVMDRIVLKKDVQRLQNAGGYTRLVYAELPLSGILSITRRFGASALSPLSVVSADVQAKSRVVIHGLVERLVKSGFDGVVINAGVVPELYGMVNAEVLHREVIGSLASFATELRDVMKKASASIIIRGGDVLARGMSSEQSDLLATLVDGVIPTVPSDKQTSDRLAHNISGADIR
jgi:hypothetical protein